MNQKYLITMLAMVILAGCNSSPNAVTASDQANVNSSSLSQAAPGNDPNSTPVSSPNTITSTPVAIPSFINSVAIGNWSGLNRGLLSLSFSAGNTPGEVDAYDGYGNLVWSKNLGVGAIKSGFDYNGDGVPDFMMVKTTAVGSCDATVLHRETAEFYSGFDGSLIASAAFDDKCILMNGTYNAAYTAFGQTTLQFGPEPGLLVLAPQYYSQGWFMQFGAGTNTYYTPETQAYETYVNRSPALQPSAQGHSYIALTQPFHGMIVPAASGARYVAFTSGRILQYSFSPLGTTQLIADTTFLSDTRLVGRTYGLMQHDSMGNRNHVSDIAGTSVHDLYRDMIDANTSGVVLGNDRWAAIERHVTTYDIETHALEQHAYSYAHDNQNSAAYVNRLAFPSRAYLPSSSSDGSRLAFNVFDGASWSIHISNPGKSDTGAIVANKIVWDIIPRGDDDVDMIVSSVDPSRQVYIPNVMTDTGVVQSWRYATYLPQWTTEVYRWNRATEQMVLLRTLPNAIPYLDVPVSNAGDQAADGMIFPSLRSMDRATHSYPVLVVRDPLGVLSEVRMDW